MSRWKYKYIISDSNSPAMFKKACELIKQSVSSFTALDLLADVDGSTIQVFENGKENIVVIDDYDYQDVIVKSDIELPFLDEVLQ